MLSAPLTKKNNTNKNHTKNFVLFLRFHHVQVFVLASSPQKTVFEGVPLARHAQVSSRRWLGAPPNRVLSISQPWNMNSSNPFAEALAAISPPQLIRNNFWELFLGRCGKIPKEYCQKVPGNKNLLGWFRTAQWRSFREVPGIKICWRGFNAVFRIVPRNVPRNKTAKFLKTRDTVPQTP